MSTIRSRQIAFSVTLALVTASIAAACSLNPQPIPPGDQPDGAGGGTNATFGDSDAGTKLSDDAGHMSNDAGSETGPPPHIDGGNDAGDASDASDDADAPG